MTPLVGLDPTSGPIEVATRQPRQRAVTLDGAVLGLVANGLGESERFLGALGEELQKHANLRGIVAVLKPSVSVPPDPIDWERLINQTTVAVAGFGG